MFKNICVRFLLYLLPTYVPLKIASVQGPQIERGGGAF